MAFFDALYQGGAIGNRDCEVHLIYIALIFAFGFIYALLSRKSFKIVFYCCIFAYDADSAIIHYNIPYMGEASRQAATYSI